MIKINYKKDNTNDSIMYEFINNDLIMKWFTDRSGDLYWVLFTKNFTPNNEYDFRIDKRSYKLYSIIENIYNDFKNGEIFYQTEMDSYLKYSATILNRNQYIRDMVREIYNTNTDIVSWDSDENSKFHTNNIKIFKDDNNFIIRFSDVVHGKLIRVCFRKNRSYYGSCGLPFFRAYENLEDKTKNSSEINNSNQEIQGNQKVKSLQTKE